MTESRLCEVCAADIRHKRSDAKWCGPNCRTEAFYVARARARKAQRLGLPTSHVRL